LDFLKLDDIYKLEINKFMHQLHYEKLPYVFYNKLIKNCTVHTHNTRLNNLMTYHIPRVNKTFTKNQISYRGVKHWNNLKDKFKSMHWVAFKKQYKSYLLNAYT